MKVSVRTLLRGAFRTIVSFGGGQIIRFGSNIILTRLLAPQLFGLMVIVNTIRMGFELLSDLGIGQNLIYSKNANEPEYYNTAWTLQLIRSFILWTLILVFAPRVAGFYSLPILASVLPFAGLGTICGGLTSVG